MDSMREKVSKLLEKDKTGHGMDHVDRVLKLALKFAEKEKADKDLVTMIALLHDVDDYKLFGSLNAENLFNAKAIMAEYKVDNEVQQKVIDSILSMGFNKLLRGIRPTLLEGKIVSDADMCDGLGVNGVIRTHAFSISNGKPFFDRNSFPVLNITAEEYVSRCSSSSVCHLFEKILKLKDLMLTKAGKEEAKKRHAIVVDILYNLFEEEDAPEWIELLDSVTKR